MGTLYMGVTTSGYDDAADSQAAWGAMADGDTYFDFLPGVDSNIVLKCVPRVPADYSSLAIECVGAMDDANGGDVVFEVYVDTQAANGGALGNRSWAAANAETVTMPSAADQNEPLNDVLVNDDSPVEHDILYIKLRRKGTDGSDNASDKLRVHHVVPIITTS